MVDTANGYLLKQANAILRRDLEEFQAVLRRRAREFKDTPCIGRTHGIHADITSFGLKWALWYEEMQRNIARFEAAAAGVEVLCFDCEVTADSMTARSPVPVKLN